MSNVIGPASAPPRPLKSPPPQNLPAQAKPVPVRMDSLALSKAPDATNTVQALLLLRRLGDQPGSALRDALGESLTAEEALARLADGSEVVARVPAQGTARSTSALLFSIDDVHALGARLANT